MDSLGTAKPWEFRWRIVIMFVSLPVCAVLFAMTGVSAGRWDAPPTVAWQRVAAACVASLGLLLRVWGTDALTAKRMLRLEAQGEALVESGPFAMVRNPLYLGTMLVIGGWSVLYGWLPLLLFAVFHMIRFHRIVVFEESLIEAEWGSRFGDYQTRVPRWLPNLFRIANSGWPRMRLAAVLSNAPFVAMTVALWAIVWTDRIRIFFPLMIMGLLVSGAFILIRRRTQRDASQDAG